MEWKKQIIDIDNNHGESTSQPKPKISSSDSTL